MKYIDEYRDPQITGRLISGIKKLAERLDKPLTIMEVCGSHTVAIGRFGIRDLLPRNVILLSGPGCPVCVTSIRDVDIAIFLAKQNNTIFATFGDMMRVPGSHEGSLQKARANGADIRVVSSALETINLAEKNSDKEIIFMGIGFETTSPTIAATIQTARKKGIGNLSVFCVHKVIPPAIKALIDDPTLNIDGFICPGHVSTIIGASAYTIITEAGRAAVITGFEPVDILEGIYMLMKQVTEHKPRVEIQYSRGVRPEGNIRAREIMACVFKTTDADWRGLGTIPNSGLSLHDASFDALHRFNIPDIQAEEIKGCSCGDILRGAKTPSQCPMFRHKCTPLNPIGPCMVSSEGTCSTYFKYHNH